MLKFAHFALAGALFIAVVPAVAQVPVTTVAASPGRVLGPPGVRREAGNWLFNDSIFVAPRQNTVAAGSPVFLANLRRDKKEKLPLFRGAATGAPLNWATLPLPTLREMMAPTFNFASLQVNLAAQVTGAGGHVYMGWSLSIGQGATPLTKLQVTPIIKQLRSILDVVAPTSSLILEVDATKNTLVSVADIDAAASACDAVWLHLNPADPNQIWPLKIARRNVEEQPDFDLPIFVSLEPPMGENVDFESHSLEYFMGGATGFITDQVPAWNTSVTHNPGLFTGAVTLEDAAVLPSQNPGTLRLVAALRAAGRVPLVGRIAEKDSNGESVFAILDDETTLDTLSGLDRAARAGASIYLEGVPDLKNKALVDRLADMTSSTIEVLPTPRRDSLNLDDPWVFGDIRGREFDVIQRVKWTLKTSLAGQANAKKGEDSGSPLAAAKLATDPNGLLLAPLGKGRISWLAHTPVDTTDPASMRAYYNAIAGNLQGALATWKFDSVEDDVRNGGKIRMAVRASKAGTPIIALWNDANADANLTLDARGGMPLVFDLSTEKTLTATLNGFLSEFPVTVPAHGFTWMTFGASKNAFDKERLAAKPKAKVMK